jgi:hypothetical protein
MALAITLARGVEAKRGDARFGEVLREPVEDAIGSKVLVGQRRTDHDADPRSRG